jgi:queuosine biosynthesis protein QueD
MIELTQEFGFDAAHYMPFKEEGHEYRRMHGHSFYAEVTLRGEPDPVSGWVRDLAEVRAVLDGIRARLDHQLLNEIPGLENPTLENLARYIHDSAKVELPEVMRVRLRRPSYGQACVYEA